MKKIIYGGSVTGTYHKDQKVPNQDAYAYKKVKSYYVMIVADGVSLNFKGKFSMSQEASQLLVDQSMKYIRRSLIHKRKRLLTIIKDAFIYSEKRLIDYIGKKDPSNYMSTLTIAIADRKGRIFYGNVGDSGIIYIDEYDDIYHATKKKESNVVHSIFEDDHWEFGYVKHVKAAIVATDGILDEFSKELRCDRYVPYNLHFINHLFVYNKAKRYKDHVFNKTLSKLSSSVTTDDKTAILYFNDIVPLYKTTPLTNEQINEINKRLNKKVFI